MGIEDVLTPKGIGLCIVLIEFTKNISVFSSFNGQITDERSNTCMVLSCIYISCSTSLLNVRLFACWQSCGDGEPVSFTLISWSGLMRVDLDLFISLI